MNFKIMIKLLLISLILNISLYSNSINDAIYQYELGYQEKALDTLSELSKSNKRAYNIASLLWDQNFLVNGFYSYPKQKRNKMKNKLIKKYNSLCDSGDMEICASFGIMYTEYNIIIQNESKISKKERLEISKKLLTKACNNGNLKGCYGLTDYEFYPSPAYKNKKRLELIKSICNQGYIPACTSYGFSCQIAQGKEKAKEAKIWFKMSCDNGNTRGCYALGKFYDLLYYNTKNKTDKRIALKSYSKACQDGNTPVEDACKKYVYLSEKYNY